MNNRKKTYKYTLKERFDNFSKYGLWVLMLGLPLILFYLFSFLFLLISSPDIPGDILSKIYRSTLEHIIMSATLIILGGFGIDLLEEKEGTKKNTPK